MTKPRKQIAERAEVYEGLPCKTCGGVRRYINCGNCVVCRRLSQRRRYHERQARKYL